MTRPRRRLLLALLTSVVLVLTAACGDDSEDTTSTTADSTEDTTTSSTTEGTDDEADEEQVPVLPDPSEERDYGIAGDERANELGEAATAHFGGRWAGVSFAYPEDELPIMRVHVVDPTDADRDWVREQAAAIEPSWADHVEVVAAVHSYAELSDAFRTVIERIGERGLALQVELDLAHNRLVIQDESVGSPVRDALRKDLPAGIVLFADEIPADEDAD